MLRTRLLVKSSAPVAVSALSAVLVAAGATRSHSPKKPEQACCHMSGVFVPYVSLGMQASMRIDPQGLILRPNRPNSPVGICPLS